MIQVDITSTHNSLAEAKLGFPTIKLMPPIVLIDIRACTSGGRKSSTQTRRRFPRRGLR